MPRPPRLTSVWDSTRLLVAQLTGSVEQARLTCGVEGLSCPYSSSGSGVKGDERAVIRTAPIFTYAAFSVVPPSSGVRRSDIPNPFGEQVNSWCSYCLEGKTRVEGGAPSTELVQS